MGLWKLSATTYEGQKFHPDCNDDGTYTCVLGGGWSKDLGLGQHWGHLDNCSVLPRVRTSSHSRL